VNDIAAASKIPATSAWEASLALSFASRTGRTVLERRAHRGPLVVQKALYPEGDAVCHSIIVHPPAGIAGGDRLRLDVRVDASARAQLTTPGAAKWYRSTSAPAQQQLDFAVAHGALLEWLPQESIVFDGALCELQTEIALEGDAIFLGWDIVCLGRRLAGERWTRGRLRHEIVVRRDGARTWMERAAFSGGSKLLDARVGLDGATVYGTFLASAVRVSDDLIGACRAIECDDGEGSVSRLPGVMLARYRGDSPEAARIYFAAIWGCARRALAGREAVHPRIWNT
jgi:urease accessory protein